MPRITRAQSMDVLSSQANLAGYQAVIDAACEYDRALPMMMTAAGTVPAAKVFVMGAGVAGLQAIATARRLGAVVSATDVRPAAKEQVASLGAKFIAVEDEEFKAAETAGGYAKEMSKEYQAKQAALVAEHIAKQDIVITTALIPGRPAPRLVTREMLKAMKPGSVAVDLAVERGGNVEGAEAGKVAEVEGVKVIGHLNVPGRIAASASGLYAKNLVTFLETMVSKETKALALNMEDELVKATALTHGGAIVNPNFEPKKKGRALMANEAFEKALDASRQGGCSRPAGAQTPAGCRGSCRCAGAWRHRRRNRSVRLPTGDLRAGDLRRLLRRLVGDAGAAHAVDGGHQRDLLGHRRWRAARGRHLGLRACRPASASSRCVLASVNIFGGFLVTQRMLAMYKKKDK